jgi:phospholipid/cholesterol/gamma-HCH transport system substrate-binding protein
LDSNKRLGRTREPLQSERGSTAARILALAALIAAVTLAALAMFGGGERYKVRAVFENAGQLVPGNQVRVGGQPLGTISEIELDDAANAVVTMELEDAVTPLHEDTTATTSR